MDAAGSSPGPASCENKDCLSWRRAVHLGGCDRNRPEVFMEDAEDRRGDISSDQTLERADAGKIRRWKRHQFRVAFGPQHRGPRPVQRLDRAASGRACPAGGSGSPPVYSKPGDKLRDAGESHQLRAPPTHCLLIAEAPDCSRKSAQ